jgi:hypothetical protein
MNATKTLVLAVVLAALAAFVFFYELPHRRLAKDKEFEGEKVLDLDYNAVTKIEVERAGEKIVFVKDKDADDWKLTQPIQDETERWMVQSLVSAFQFARPTRMLKDVDADSLKRFGLDKPRGTITLEAGAVTKRVRIGDVNPVGKNVYVKPEDQNVVFLIPDSTMSALEKSLADFRRHELLAVRGAMKLKRIEVAAAGQPPLTVVKIEPPKKEAKEGEEEEPLDARVEDVWRVGGPDGPIADAEVMRTIADRIAAVKALRFVDEPDADPAKFGLDKPAWTIAATYGDGEKDAKEITHRLSVGAPLENSRERYARVDGRACRFVIEAAAVEPLELDRDKLRDRRLFAAVDLTKAAVIDLQSPKASFRISRSPAGDWAFADGAPADKGRAEDLLKAAGAWRAEELVEGPRAAKLGGAAKRGEGALLSLYDADGKLLNAVRFSAALDPEAIAPSKKPEKPAKEAKEATPAPVETAAKDKERLTALVDGGYPGVVYVTKTKPLADLPASVDEMKAPAKPAEAPAEESPEAAAAP